MEAKVERLLQELQQHRDNGNKNEERRTKNLICAYESRINKRSQLEEAKEKLSKREDQISVVFSVLNRELKAKDLEHISAIIMKEVPR